MFLLWIFAAYVLLLLIVRVFERRMIFVPDYPGRLEGDWRPQTLGPEDVWLTSSDGTKLRYWWVSEPNARFPFLAFHGNASNIANRAPTYEFLQPTYSLWNIAATARAKQTERSRPLSGRRSGVSVSRQGKAARFEVDHFIWPIIGHRGGLISPLIA
jgi:hypothetical protein